MRLAIMVKKGGKHSGRLYPAAMPSRAERQRMIDWSHWLHCHDGLSIRQTMTALEGHGIRRSRGSVHAYLRDYVCDSCRPDRTKAPADTRPCGQPISAPSGPAPQPQRERARVHRWFEDGW